MGSRGQEHYAIVPLWYHNIQSQEVRDWCLQKFSRNPLEKQGDCPKYLLFIDTSVQISNILYVKEGVN